MSAYAKTFGLMGVLLVAFIAARVLADPVPQAKRDQPASAGAAAAATTATSETAAPTTRSSRGPKTYEPVPVTDGGTIRVTCKLSKALDEQNVPFNKDQGPGKCGHDARLNERAQFDPATLALPNCVVYLADISRGKDFAGELAQADREIVLDQHECRYVPHVMLARPGSRVSIKNSDGVQHNVKGFFNNAATMVFNVMSSSHSELDPTDDTTLKKVGNYLLQCDIHKWMTGYIRTAPHPYFAVTGADGTCTLTDVPPGKYTLACWHEGMLVTLEMKGADIDGYRYSPDFNAPEQVITVPAGGTVDAVFTIDPR